ncbi:hypothetical protein F4778DRAFT_643712 [Xylariomycetidae sp. FL2044]|nr:hypothetical protein F4778DRAFT_643712 [Xylariomycetidae sp. FL2044]
MATHKSTFSYNITRPYPFRWLTPVVVVGGIILTALVSFVNVATSGYQLVATSSSNPNQTVDDPSSYGNIKWPSYLTKNTRATCAATTIPLKSEIFTANNAIPYTLSSVWRMGEDGKKNNLGSLVYHNNVLRECNITKTNIEVLGKYAKSIGETAIAKVGLNLRTYATCSIDVDTSMPNTAKGPTFLQLVGTYNLLDESVPRFLSRNETEKPSLYWAESMLRMYWMVLSKAYYDGSNGTSWGDDSTYNAVITLSRRSEELNGTREEVMSDEFFSVGCFTEASYCGEDSIAWLSEGHSQWDPYPGIWSSVDTLGKSMWFAVMTDLGFNDTTVPNMLAYPDLLASLSRNLTNDVDYWRSRYTEDGNKTEGVHMSPVNDLATKSFDPSATTPPPQHRLLGATPAVLSTNYICQVPQAKPAGTLFLSVLLADLVLLQAAWFLFKLCVDSYLYRRYPDQRPCEGCFGMGEGQDTGAEPLVLSVVTHGEEQQQDPWKSAPGSNIELTRYSPVGSGETLPYR